MCVCRCTAEPGWGWGHALLNFRNNSEICSGYREWNSTRNWHFFNYIRDACPRTPPPPTPPSVSQNHSIMCPRPPTPAISIDPPALLHILLDTNDFMLKLFFYTLKFNMISTGTAKFFCRISLSPQNFSHPPDHPVLFFSFLFINFIWDLLPMNPMLSVYRFS